MSTNLDTSAVAVEMKAVCLEILEWADTARSNPELTVSERRQVTRIRGKAEKILWQAEELTKAA